MGLDVLIFGSRDIGYIAEWFVILTAIAVFLWYWTVNLWKEKEAYSSALQESHQPKSIKAS